MRRAENRPGLLLSVFVLGPLNSQGSSGRPDPGQNMDVDQRCVRDGQGTPTGTADSAHEDRAVDCSPSPSFLRVWSTTYRAGVGGGCAHRQVGEIVLGLPCRNAWIASAVGLRKNNIDAPRQVS